MSITVDTMRPQLLDLDTVRTLLQRTEPTQADAFTIGDAVRFEAAPNYNFGMQARDPMEPIGVWVVLDRKRRYQLTRTALEETCLTFGFKRNYVLDCPADLLVPHMNYWFREGLFNYPRKGRDFQYILNGDIAAAFTKQGMTPFSNLTLLDQAVTAITERYGNVEILADHKLHHTLRQTSLRLVIPNAYQVLSDTGTPDDIWSRGVQIKNSLTGQSQTSFDGYLFRWVCTNGQIDTRATSGTWTRRKDATEDEVYAWARQAVDDALSGLDGALDTVQNLTHVGIDGSLSDTLRDIFEHYHISIHQRAKIITALEHYDGEITMYVIMNAITQTANESGMDPSTVETLLRIGGDMPYTAKDRCGACHRLMHSH